MCIRPDLTFSISGVFGPCRERLSVGATRHSRIAFLVDCPATVVIEQAPAIASATLRACGNARHQLFDGMHIANVTANGCLRNLRHQSNLVTHLLLHRRHVSHRHVAGLRAARNGAAGLVRVLDDAPAPSGTVLADAVLVDAPCSSTGALRSPPKLHTVTLVQAGDSPAWKMMRRAPRALGHQRASLKHAAGPPVCVYAPCAPRVQIVTPDSDLLYVSNRPAAPCST